MQNLSSVNIYDQEADNQDKLSELEAYELYDDMLNECNPSWHGFSPAHILKNVDQIAYRCGFNDYSDSLTERYDLTDWY